MPLSPLFVEQDSVKLEHENQKVGMFGFTKHVKLMFVSKL